MGATDLPKGPPPRGTIVYDGREWFAKRCREGVNVVSTSEVVVCREIQRLVGEYRPTLPHPGDFDMWLRFAAISEVGYVRAVPQAYYRIHSPSMSQGVYRDQLANVRQRKAVFDSVFEEHQREVRELGLDVGRTYRTHASESLCGPVGCTNVGTSQKLMSRRPSTSPARRHPSSARCGPSARWGGGSCWARSCPTGLRSSSLLLRCASFRTCSGGGDGRDIEASPIPMEGTHTKDEAGAGLRRRVGWAAKWCFTNAVITCLIGLREGLLIAHLAPRGDLRASVGLLVYKSGRLAAKTWGKESMDDFNARSAATGWST